MSNALVVEKLSKAIVIEFNRPEIRSPLSTFILKELREVLEEATEDSKLTTIIFTGKANVFASGADLREIAKINADTAKEFAQLGQNLMNTIANIPKLTIAAVNGYCFGGALDLALACDKRIASPNATFAHPGANLGIITGWGGTQRLPRLIGEAKALEMFFTAKAVNANEALRIGLIDRIEKNPLAFSIANYAKNQTSITV